MSLRSVSKGRETCVPARRLLFALLTASLLSGGGRADAVMLSANDPDRAAAMTPVADSGRFEGVGRIECPDAAEPRLSHIATGWVLGSADTVVTAAHAFFEGGRTADPRGCVFALYDRNQKLREVAAIRYAVSPWTERRYRNDSSYDVAVLKLERPVKVANIPAVMAFSGTEKALVDLVAFHTGIRDAQRAWITRGRLDDFPSDQLRRDAAGLRITNARRLFSTSADSTPGSSGGMYYDERLHAAVGLHVGAMCDQVQPRYNPDSCFNYGLRFDSAIVAMLDRVVHDQPQDQRITGDNPTRLVLALSDRR